MKLFIATLCAIAILASADAGDRKAHGKAAYAYACSCAQQTTAKPAEAKPVTKPEPVAATATVTSEGSCASGTCGTSSSSGLFRRSRR